METSKFLAKVIGLYLMISGLWLVVQRSGLEGILQDFTQSPALVAFAGRVALLIGLLLVASHNRWRADWTVLITVVGWLVVLSGLVSLFLPDTVAQMGQTMTLGAGFFLVYGIVGIAIGGFLAYKGSPGITSRLFADIGR
jgi:hypothetical protein